MLDTAAALAEQLLINCPNLRILTTTRERLGLPGERLLTVQPLPLDSDAVALFYERVAQVAPELRPDRTVVAELCARLDGLPLAIELAAARTVALGMDGLVAVMDDALRVLGGRRGGDSRHGSMRALLAWSHDLLDEESKTLFRRFAVFAGSVDLAAVVEVTGGDRAAVADLLGRLVDKSLLVYESGSGRWRMLDTIRAFALEMLDASGERAEIQDRHLRWTAAIASRLVNTPAEFDAVAGELRTALAAGDQLVRHELARALGHLTLIRRYLHESIDHFRLAAELAPTPDDAATDLINAAACTFVATTSGPETAALQLAAADLATGRARALALCRAATTMGRYQVVRAADARDIPEHLLEEAAAAAGDEAEPSMAAALAVAAAWTRGQGSTAAAEQAVSAARTTGDPVLISTALDALGFALHRARRLRDIRQVTEERVTLASSMDPDDPVAAAEITDVVISHCVDALVVGDLEAARVAGRRLPDFLGPGSYIAAGLQVPALVLTGQLDIALEHANRMWHAWQRAGGSRSAWVVQAVAMAALACLLGGDTDGFNRWRARTLEVAGSDEVGRVAAVVFLDASAALSSGDFREAATLVELAFGDFGPVWLAPYLVAVGAELAVAADLPDARGSD